MSVVDNFLKKMKMVSDDDYDDYDEFDDFDDEEEADEEIISKKKVKTKTRQKPVEEPEEEVEDYDDEEEESYSSAYSTPGKTSKSEAKQETPRAQQNTRVVSMAARSATSEVCQIIPKSFDDANTIVDVLLSHKAVVLNLESIDMTATQRIVDFATGACYTIDGNMQKISNKIFIVTPPDMKLSGDFEDMVGDVLGLNSVNLMK